MLIFVLFQCFKYVLGPVYQPLGENDVGNDPPLPFNEPRWVLVNFPHSPPYPPNVPHPQCILDRAHNYMLETHPSILGNALFPANANGPSAIYPRYYIMKRRVTYPGIQVLALLTPEARQMQPNRFRNQLLSIFCQNGYVETIDPVNRVQTRFRITINGRIQARIIRDGTCGIEEKLIKICLQDRKSLPVPEINSIFRPNLPLNNLYRGPDPGKVQNVRTLASRCQKFFIIDMPTVRDRHMRSDRASTILKYYLNAAQQAGFDRVLLNGLGLGAECEQQIGWGIYILDDVIENIVNRIRYIESTSENGFPQQWYFCKTV